MLNTLIINNPGKDLNVTPLEGLKDVEVAFYAPYVMELKKDDWMDRSRATIAVVSQRRVTRAEVTKALGMDESEILAQYFIDDVNASIETIS